MRRIDRRRNRNVNLPQFGIGWNEQDAYAYIVGVRFRYFKSEKKRRRFCLKLERSPYFAGYFGRINFE